MFVLLHGLPLVTLPNGQSIPFQKAWVKGALEKRAFQQGYGSWWFARDLAESVELYLQREWKEKVITFTELEAIIKELLLSIRFSDLALAFSLPPPPATLSLLDLAREAGEGYELLFFQLLKDRLQKIAHSSVEQLEIEDLEASLRYLFHRKRLGRKEAKGHIVSYIRGCSRHSSLLRENFSQPLEITIK